MNNEEIINKVKLKNTLSYDELAYFFNGYLNGTINDDDMTKMLKAIVKYKLNKNEIFDLCDIFIKSGEVLDLSNIKNLCDKHSTGGIGDKTTLIIAPIVACLGVNLVKMSGKGLGYTGGTIDKLESINVNTDLDYDTLYENVSKFGFAITKQTSNLCPLDKKVYALRDVTNTTEDIGLIATSIMSKKIACSSKNIVIDLKVGKGALIKNKKDALKLATIMKEIGIKYNRNVICVLTDMNKPLGYNIGNKIEIMEVLEFLQNKVRGNLYELCVYLASKIVEITLNIPFETAKIKVIEQIENGNAYKRFVSYVTYNNGNINILKLPDGLKVYATHTGYIKDIDALNLGKTSVLLGAGRKTKDDLINYDAGIIIEKHVTAKVLKGDVLCTLYGNTKNINTDVSKYFKISKIKQKPKSVIIGCL